MSYAGAADRHHGLRHVQVDHGAGAQSLQLHVRDRLELHLGRQLAEGTVDQPARGIGVDVADHAELEIVAGQYAAGEIAHVVRRDACNGFERAADRASVRVIGECGRPRNERFLTRPTIESARETALLTEASLPGS